MLFGKGWFVLLLWEILKVHGGHMVHAQGNLRHYALDEGLPGIMSYYVMQDRRGYIWIGTESGVARFDGYAFTNFFAG
ncbi:MAG: two-component regulator propeller domain-containing protein, partial [Bacteroidota bacterium]